MPRQRSRHSLANWFRSRSAKVERDTPRSSFVWPVQRRATTTAACLVRQGVLVDELRMFAHALEGHNVGCANVGHSIGRISGVAGTAIVDMSFGDHDRTDSIVFIPGGIGILEAVNDAQLVDWIDSVVRHADWVIASSTGSLLVAATGALDGRSASTHWLATTALHGLGADASVDRMTVAGNVITCSGQSTIAAAVELALSTVAREGLTPTGERVGDSAWRRPAS